MRGRAAPPHPGIYRVPPRVLAQGVLKSLNKRINQTWGLQGLTGSWARSRSFQFTGSFKFIIPNLKKKNIHAST